MQGSFHAVWETFDLLITFFIRNKYLEGTEFAAVGKVESLGHNDKVFEGSVFSFYDIHVYF